MKAADARLLRQSIEIYPTGIVVVQALSRTLERTSTGPNGTLRPWLLEQLIGHGRHEIHHTGLEVKRSRARADHRHHRVDMPDQCRGHAPPNLLEMHGF